jgi:putative ABC transport system permease protein
MSYMPAQPSADAETRSHGASTFGAWRHRRGELKQAWRSLARTPWYALTVAGVVALSITLTTTVFAIVDGVLFKPLPYPSVDRIFAVSTGHSKLPDSLVSIGVVSEVDVQAWAEALPEARFTAFYTGGDLTTGTDEEVRSARVDAAFFDVIGMRPMTGGFEPADFAARTKIEPALLTHGYWLRRFGGNPSVVGRTFVGEGGAGFRVAGILPPDFVFPSPSPIEALTPRVRSASPSRGLSLNVLTRLPATLPLPETSARLASAAAQVAAMWPPLPPMRDVSERRRILSSHVDVVKLQPIGEAIAKPWRATSWLVFWAAVALVLLALVNVTGLAIARVQDRWRELALRQSLGARYVDVVRLLGVEHALVVGAGTVAGVWAARPVLATTVRLMSKGWLFLKAPVIDARVLAFTALTAVSAVALITLGSARAASRSSLRSAIVEGGMTTRRVRRKGLSIVSVQVALAFVMAVGGALVGGSLLRVWGEAPGFDVSRTAIVHAWSPVRLPAAAGEDLMAGLRRLPGIEHAGGIDKPLLELAFNGSDFDRPAGVMQQTIVESMAMTDGYLAAAGLAPIDGRVPTASEFAIGAPVIVVSDIVAHQYWPGLRAVGQSLLNEGRPFTVVGVVPDARYLSLDREPQGAIYCPLAAQGRGFPTSMLVMFAPDGRASLADVAAGITRLCPTCHVLSAQMMREVLGTTIRPRRLNAWLFSSFGFAALVIAGTGMLGLVAMTTNRRTREVGIRMALGATPMGVVRQILREQVAAVVVGLLAGGLIAAWAVRFVSAFLYKTTIYDGWAWAAAVAALLLVSLVGGLVPSLRASRIDPVQALRAE